jgi:glycosyltransferase involved in cell wall biosynthesis
MTTPSVSAVLCVWNGARFLGAALDSVRAQERPADEIIVIDDGSTDETPAIAAAPDLRSVRIEHGGVAAARNRGLDEARGDIIAWLDADDCWTPDKLRRQIEHMVAHPETALTFTRARFRLHPGVQRPRWIAPAELEADNPCFGTGTLAVWRWAVDRIGRFDPALHIAEDTDWIVRAVDLGMSLGIVPHTLLVRGVHDRNLSFERKLTQLEVLKVLRASIARKRAHTS